MNKFTEASGLFWGASLFMGALASIIILIRSGPMLYGLIVALLIGSCVFLTTGLIFQGIVTLLKKDKEE